MVLWTERTERACDVRRHLDACAQHGQAEVVLRVVDAQGAHALLDMVLADVHPGDAELDRMRSHVMLDGGAGVRDTADSGQAIRVPAEDLGLGHGDGAPAVVHGPSVLPRVAFAHGAHLVRSLPADR